MPATAVGDRSHRDRPVASHRDWISRGADVRCGIGDPVDRGRPRRHQGEPRHWANRRRRSSRHRRPRRFARLVPGPGAPASVRERCHNGRFDREIRPECRPACCHRIRSVLSWPRSNCCAGSLRNSPWLRRPAGHPASSRPSRPGHPVAAVPIVRWVADGRAWQGPGRGFPVQRGRATVGRTCQFEYRTGFRPSSTSCSSPT